MYFRQFDYLIAVVEEKHFGRAASRCNATQPSLSNGIKQLELELGVQIFLRGRGQKLHGLTAEGERIVSWARLIVSHCNAMRDEIDALQGDLRGELRIGATPFSSPVLPLILQMIRADFPHVRVNLRCICDEAIKTGFATFAIDAAITYTEFQATSRCNALPLYTEKLSLLVPDIEDYAGRTAISWADAAKVPLALLGPSAHERKYVDDAFSAVGVVPTPEIESGSIFQLMFQVPHTRVCTIIPSHFAQTPGLQKGTRALQLVEPTRGREVGLLWGGGVVTMPMASMMVHIIKKMKAAHRLPRFMNGGDEVEPAILRLENLANLRMQQKAIG